MKNILLVDDDKTFNFISTKILERTGMARDIHTAWNGKQALDLFNNYFQGTKAFPDVILLDLNMPIMDGFQFLEAFNKLMLPGKEKVRIVILSSSVDPKDSEKARQLGAFQFLAKPLNEEQLMEVLTF